MDTGQTTDSSIDVIYLHGFASGPKSKKAIFFKNALSEMGIRCDIPDLNQPSFENMTLTSQLAVVSYAISKSSRNKKLVIIGSSMGGLLATLKASEPDNLAALILLAPGFGLKKRWPDLIGEQALTLWGETGSLEVFNYEVGKKMPLSYKFFEDINKYETDELSIDIPTLIFHGKNDETVPIAESLSFTKRNQDYVQLHVMDDDHQLISSLPDMWMSTRQFLTSL